MAMDIGATVATQASGTKDHKTDVATSEIIAKVVTVLWAEGVHAPVKDPKSNDQILIYWNIKEA